MTTYVLRQHSCRKQTLARVFYDHILHVMKDRSCFWSALEHEPKFILSSAHLFFISEGVSVGRHYLTQEGIVGRVSIL